MPGFGGCQGQFQGQFENVSTALDRDRHDRLTVEPNSAFDQDAALRSRDAAASLDESAGIHGGTALAPHQYDA